MNFSELDEFYEFFNDELQSWIESGIRLLPNPVKAFFIAIVLGIFVKVAENLLRKVLFRSNAFRHIADLLTSTKKELFLLTGIFIAMDFVSLNSTVSYLLICAGINSTYGLGASINLLNPYAKRCVKPREMIFSKILFQNNLPNYSGLEARRIELPVGVSSADKPDEARKTNVEAVNDEGFPFCKKETEVNKASFGYLNFFLSGQWMKFPGAGLYRSYSRSCGHYPSAAAWS